MQSARKREVSESAASGPSSDEASSRTNEVFFFGILPGFT